MFISFSDVDVMKAEIQAHPLEMESEDFSPIVRVQDYVNTVQRLGSTFMTFVVEAAAKNAHGDVLLYRETVGRVDHWGEGFESEDRRVGLVARTHERTLEIEALFKAIGCNVRSGRFVEDPKLILNG